MDLDGTTGNGNTPAGELDSLASFGPGSFTLSFDLRGNGRKIGPNPAPAQTTVVSLGAWSTSITQPNAAPFTHYSFTFASGLGGKLRFAENSASDQRGNVLDNVLLTTAATPEPASWSMMLVGFAIAGGALRHRRLAAV